MLDMELYSMFLFATCVCCMQSGQPQDAKDDVKGKPESQKSKIARMFGQWFGKGSQMLADSGVIKNDEANTAIGAAGTMIQEQAEMDPTETSASEFTHTYCIFQHTLLTTLILLSCIIVLDNVKHHVII